MRKLHPPAAPRPPGRPPATGGPARLPFGSAPRSALHTAVLALLVAVGPHVARAGPGLALAPGIAFTWTAPAAEGLLSFRFRRGPSSREPITGVTIPARHLAVTGYRLGPDDDRLDVRVRADAAGVIEVPSVVVRTRYAPPQRLQVGAAEVVALARADGPLRLAAWTSDDELGLYAAFALVNDAAVPVTVRRLRYAPEPLDRGLVLVATGPPDAFAAWEASVLRRMAPAFAAYLEGHGRSPATAARPVPPPPSLAFPLRGDLASASWHAPDALAVVLEPGEALFLALTPAAFKSYVHDLPIHASPVVGYALGTGAGCCELQGVPATVQHLPRHPPSGAPVGGEGR